MTLMVIKEISVLGQTKISYNLLNFYLIFGGSWLQREWIVEEVDQSAVEQQKGELQTHSCLKKLKGRIFSVI